MNILSQNILYLVTFSDSRAFISTQNYLNIQHTIFPFKAIAQSDQDPLDDIISRMLFMFCKEKCLMFITSLNPNTVLSI